MRLYPTAITQEAMRYLHPALVTIVLAMSAAALSSPPAVAQQATHDHARKQLSSKPDLKFLHGAPTDAADSWALSSGGRMYDNWWEALGRTKPRRHIGPTQPRRRHLDPTAGGARSATAGITKGATEGMRRGLTQRGSRGSGTRRAATPRRSPRCCARTLMATQLP
jgi:hypothetical protein